MGSLGLNSKSYIFCLFLLGLVSQYVPVYLGVNGLCIFNYTLEFLLNSICNLICKLL